MANPNNNSVRSVANIVFNNPIIDTMDVTTAGTAEQLPDIPITPGGSFMIKAKSANTNNIYLGTTKARAEAAANRWTLDANETLILEFDNMNRLWMDADTDGEGIEYIVQKNIF